MHVQFASACCFISWYTLFCMLRLKINHLQGESRAKPETYVNIQLVSTVDKYFFFLWRCDWTRIMASSFLRFLDHTQRRVTVGWTPLDEWSARRRDLYLTTHNTHYRQTSMPPVGFEHTISAGERPQTYALDRVATETGRQLFKVCKYRILL
jgi:hypothetical protein